MGNNTALQLRRSATATVVPPIEQRYAVSLRSLMSLVYAPAVLSEKTPASEQCSWQIVLRTANDVPLTSTNIPARRYLWVRRTSRRAYNNHMSKMRETLVDMRAMPALVLFSSLIAIAFCLSVLMH